MHRSRAGLVLGAVKLASLILLPLSLSLAAGTVARLLAMGQAVPVPVLGNETGWYGLVEVRMPAALCFKKPVGELLRIEIVDLVAGWRGQLLLLGRGKSCAELLGGVYYVVSNETIPSLVVEAEPRREQGDLLALLAYALLFAASLLPWIHVPSKLAS